MRSCRANYFWSPLQSSTPLAPRSLASASARRCISCSSSSSTTPSLRIRPAATSNQLQIRRSYASSTPIATTTDQALESDLASLSVDLSSAASSSTVGAGGEGGEGWAGISGRGYLPKEVRDKEMELPPNVRFEGFEDIQEPVVRGCE